MGKVKNGNYRQYYKEYYGIEFGDDMDIHHLDWNRNNNEISNLLLIPKEIHQTFHKHCKSTQVFIKKYGNPKNLSLTNGHTYDVDMMENYVMSIIEFEKWYGFKCLKYKFCDDSRIIKKV